MYSLRVFGYAFIICVSDVWSSSKVVIVLEELGLPYTISYLEFNEVKNEDYVKLNPNGRLPTIEDPNTGIVLWEVCLASVRIEDAC